MAVPASKKLGASQPLSGASVVPSAILNGAMPAGGSATPARHKATFQGGSYNRSLKVTVTTSGTPQLMEPLGPAEGSTVRIRTYDANQQTMYFADSPATLLKGMGEPLAAGYEIIFPYQKGRLWFMGENNGDYATVSVRSE